MTSCIDWESRIKKGESILPAPIFPDRADIGERFFGHLKLTDVIGHPRLKDTSKPWIIDFVRNIFGAYDEESNKQLIREFFVLISKKNSKSTAAAGIMLTALLLNQRTNAEMVILAPTVEIAKNAYDPLRGMIKEEEDLSDLLRVQDHIRTVTHRLTGATLKVIAADSDTVGGLKASFILIDEVWLFGKRRNSENMFREATGGLTSRPEGFVIYLTTQSDEPPAGVFRQKLDYARKVRDGVIEDKQFLPLLYEFPKNMVLNNEWRDPKNWHITNPNIGASVDIDYLKREYSKAINDGDQSMRGFAAKHLNVEIGIALSNDSWAGAEFWEQCSSKVDIESLINRSEVIVAGIDGGGLDDLMGLSLAGRCKETGNWLYYFHAWAHKIVFERRKDIAENLLDFEKEGSLTIVDKPSDDVRDICAILSRVKEEGLMPEKNAVGVDAAGIGAVVEELTDKHDFIMEEIIAIGQGWKLNGAIKTLERKLAAAEVEHDGSLLMNWAVGNAKIVPVGNAVRIDKQASGSAKIDPLMAGLNATQLISLNPKAAPKRGAQVYIF